MNKLVQLFLLIAVLTSTATCRRSPEESTPEQIRAEGTVIEDIPEEPTPIEEPMPESPRVGDTWTRPADGMVMVYVPSGEFQMGSDDDGVSYAMELCDEEYGDCARGWFADEQPAHAVSLDGFWVDRTEVTNAQYRQCVEVGACEPPGKGGSSTRDAYYGDSAYDDYPVIYASWHQAAAYCEWAGGRLPTEAEWEYAARGPEGRAFPWGDAFDGARLNYCDVNCELEWRDAETDDGYADTAPVGSYSAGASWCGAQDLAGNVWEWTADWYGEYASERQVNPTGPSSGRLRVQRGGSWDNESVDTRGAYRSRNSVDGQSYNAGFRCVRGSE